MSADVVPDKEIPKMGASRRLEDLREVAPNIAPGAVGAFADIASTSEGGLSAGPSEGPDYGVEWVIIQPGVPSDFARNEREEDDV